MTKTPKSTKGFTCPDCVGVRLFVFETERPMPNVVRRFRECSCCGYRVKTEERIAKGKQPASRLMPKKKRHTRREPVANK